MEELLSRLSGHEIDLVCLGGVSLRGKVGNVSGGVLQLTDEDGNSCHVNVQQIVAVWEKRDKDRHPGFIFKKLG
jgi:hypothetical protein